jgi:pantoate--beta-alanine ligase
MIIRKLVKDLNMGVEVVVCPTVREADGLAMSSRNRYLTQEQRNAAAVVYRSLLQAAEAVKSGIIDVGRLKELMRDTLRSEPLVSEIQYCSAYDPESLVDVEQIGSEALLAVALKIGNTRLIDNMLVRPPAEA